MGNCYSCLDHNQSIIKDYPRGRVMAHGPGCFFTCCSTVTKIDKLVINKTQYIKITYRARTREYYKETEMLDEMEKKRTKFFEDQQKKRRKKSSKRVKRTSSEDEMIIIEDDEEMTHKHGVKTVQKNNDIVRIFEGPGIYEQVDPYAIVSEIMNKIKIKKNRYIIVSDQSGKKKVIEGPCLYTPGPYDEFIKHNDSIIHRACILNNNEYIYVTHDNGQIDIVEGPCRFVPGPYDSISRKKDVIALQHDEYIKIKDSNTGQIRVATGQGEGRVVLGQYEKTLGDVSRAMPINDLNAVMIKDTETGKRKLISMDDRPFMFFPTATQVVLKKHKKIRLEKHEAMIIVDKEGNYSIQSGETETRAFFIPPYCHILEQDWSTDLEKNHGNTEKVSRFDLRPQYMDFEFLIRTKDNVEIILDLNFYWQIIDVGKMIGFTNDPPQDICNHAASQILSEVSKIDMKDFMETFNDIVQSAVHREKDTFYQDRGVNLIRVEITGRRCKDENTERNFQDIIKEKTDRIKNLERKEGENEIELTKLEGQKKAEVLRGELVRLKKGYLREEAESDGQSLALGIKNFMESTGMPLEQSMHTWNQIQINDRIEKLIESGNQLIIPQEKLVDFKIHDYNINYNTKAKKHINRNIKRSKRDKKGKKFPPITIDLDEN